MPENRHLESIAASGFESSLELESVIVPMVKVFRDRPDDWGVVSMLTNWLDGVKFPNKAIPRFYGIATDRDEWGNDTLVVILAHSSTAGVRLSGHSGI